MKQLFSLSIFLLLLGCQASPSEVDGTFTDQKATQPGLSAMEDQELYRTILSMDSLFFDVAYNQCDTLLGKELISNDFEFYHDKGGALLNTTDALASDIMIQDLSWIGKQTMRKLVPESLKVFPLYENEKLYGALQSGDHHFFSVEDKQPKELKVKAKFIHLWILEDGKWKLSRVISYDHQNVNDRGN